MNRLPDTPHSLLRRLGQGDRASDADWAAFVETYGKVILNWCCRFGLQVNDAEDVSQEVLRKLFTGIRNYRREVGRFRSYLKTVVQREVGDFCDKLARRAERGRGGDSDGLLANHADPATLVAQLMDTLIADLRQAVFERLASRVNPDHLAAFRRLVEHGASPQQVAEELAVTVKTVYKIKSDLKQKFEEELERVDRDGLAAPPP